MPSSLSTDPDLGSKHTHIHSRPQQAALAKHGIHPPTPSWPSTCGQTMHSHLPTWRSPSSSPRSSPAQAQHACIRFCTASGPAGAPGSISPQAAPVEEPARHQPQPLLSSQTRRVPEEQSEASLEQPAGGEGQSVSLTYLPGRQHAHKSDRHKVQILSKAVAAALGALVPGDRAKACIKQFTALTRPEFSGTEKVLTNQIPWQGPTSNACCPSHTTTALCHQLC